MADGRSFNRFGFCPFRRLGIGPTNNVNKIVTAHYEKSATHRGFMGGAAVDERKEGSDYNTCLEALEDDCRREMFIAFWDGKIVGQKDCSLDQLRNVWQLVSSDDFKEYAKDVKEYKKRLRNGSLPADTAPPINPFIHTSGRLEGSSNNHPSDDDKEMDLDEAEVVDYGQQPQEELEQRSDDDDDEYSTDGYDTSDSDEAESLRAELAQLKRDAEEYQKLIREQEERLQKMQESHSGQTCRADRATRRKDAAVAETEKALEKLKKLDTDLEKVTKEKNAAVQETEKALEKVKHLETELDRVSREKNAAVQETKKALEKHKQLETELEKVTKEKNVAVQETEKALEKLKKLDTDLEKVTKEKARALENAQLFHKLMAEAKQQLELVTKERDRINAELAEKKQELETARGQTDKDSATITALQTRLDEATECSKCPTLTQQIVQQEENISSLQGEVVRQDGIKKELRTENEKFGQVIKDLQAKLTKLVQETSENKEEEALFILPDNDDDDNDNEAPPPKSARTTPSPKPRVSSLPKRKKSVQCTFPDCKRMFTFPSGMFAHRQSHEGYYYLCPDQNCHLFAKKYKFMTKTNRNLHIRKQHQKNVDGYDESLTCIQNDDLDEIPKTKERKRKRKE